MAYYLCSVIHPGGEPPPPEVRERQARDNEAFVQELRAAPGVWVFGGRLQPPGDATVAWVRDGDALVTDGPYVESKEHVAGILVIEVSDRATALEWARRQSRACRLPIEVRPFHSAGERP